MNIKQIINQIIDLDNENKSLKNKLEKLEKTNNIECLTNIVEIGKEQIIDEIKEEIFIKGVESVSSYYMDNLTIFDCLYPTYKIKKPIRLIELFAGIGSQAKD